MIIKVHVQHAHSGVNGGPWHDERLAVDALAHDIEGLARAADTRTFLLMMARATANTPATTIVVAGVRREKNVLPRKLAHAHRPHNVPNRDRASCIDRQRMHAIAEQFGAHEPRSADEDKVR